MVEKAVPNNVQAEQSVIASILVDAELLPQVKLALNASDFFSEPCRFTFIAIDCLHGWGDEVNQLTVWNELVKQDRLHLVGRDSMSSWIGDLETCYMIDSYIEIVKRNSIARQLIQVAGVIAQIAYENNLTAVTMVHRALTALDWVDTQASKQVSSGASTYKGLRRVKES